MIDTNCFKSPLVPANYWGVWQRNLLETSTIKDTNSLVLWMQTERYHIDLRVPINCQICFKQAEALQDYNNDELLLLANQQGFAGITQVIPATENASDICQWFRHIDYQPTTNQRDIGKMIFIDSNTVIEIGIDEYYTELWHRLENSQQPQFFATTFGSDRSGFNQPAYLMRAGKFVAYARNRAADLPKLTSLNLAIKTLKPAREQLLDWLDMEISFGEMLDDKRWQIKYSSLPFRKGAIVLL